MRRQLRGAPSPVTSTCPPVNNVASMLLLAYMHTRNKACNYMLENYFQTFFFLLLMQYLVRSLMWKKNLTVWRGAEEILRKFKHCHCQILQPDCSEIQLIHLVEDKDTASSSSLGAKSNPPNKKHISDSEHLCFSDYFLPSHVSLRPATPQQDTGGNSGGKVNIQSLVW